MDNANALKLIGKDDNGSYQVEVAPVVFDETTETVKAELAECVRNIDVTLDSLHFRHQALEEKIDFYTNHADKLDYIVAVASGIITAIIDALLKEHRIKSVLGADAHGKDILDFFNESGKEQAEEKIKELAQKDKLQKAVEKSKKAGNSTVGTTRPSGDNLESIMGFLEKRFNLPSDSLTSDFGGSKQHHLRDFAHHPSIIGLICSLLTQFTEKCYGTDTSGRFVSIKLKFYNGKKGRIAKAGKEIRIIGDTIHEKIIIGTTVWYYHLISDMAGSTSTPGAGMGIPGPLLSMAKELSVLPIFRNKDNENGFSKLLSKMYNGTLFATRDENGKMLEARKIDFRTEMGLAKELKKQAGPVIINELLVRGFYFVRRLFMEIKEKNIKSFTDLKYLDIQKVLPFRNRTIVRMLTVSTGAFTATNLTVAAGIGAAKSAGNPALFAKEFVLRINFVGVGRFAVAVGADVVEGIKKSHLENELSNVETQMIALNNAKAYYLQAGVWTEMQNTEAAAQSLEKTMHTAMTQTSLMIADTAEAMESIEENLSAVDEDEELKDELLDILEWS